MYGITKLVSKKVFQELIRKLPLFRRNKLGRPKAEKEALLNGILQVLVNGSCLGKDCFMRAAMVYLALIIILIRS